MKKTGNTFTIRPELIKSSTYLSSSFFLTLISVTVILFLLSFSYTTSAQEIRTNKDSDAFMWVGAQKLGKEDPKLLENILLFANRFEILPYSSGLNEPQELGTFLKTCKELNISKTWIEIGPGDVTLEEFAKDSSKRTPDLERFKALAKTYKKYYPDFARITIFDEAPLGAFKLKNSQEKSGYLPYYHQFKEYGPKAYSYLFKALKQTMPDAEVGIFLHHPHNASEKMAGSYSLIEEFMEKCQNLKAVPDFIFSDVYRGYINRGCGVETTDAYITDVVRNTKKVAEKYNAEAYQLGQMHTIKLGYTPSRYQIDRNIDAMLKGNPDGIGWYWPNYASTNYERQQGDGIGKPTGYDVSFDPFVPNAWGNIGPAGSIYGTSKDRFVYSYLRILEKQGKLNPDSRFDLWLYGHDFDHVEHTVYLKTNEKHGGQWQKIGHFNPQQDKDAYEKEAREEYMYSYNDKWHALAFHALPREKYVFTSNEQDHKLKIKIVTSENSDKSKLSAAYVMPYRKTRNYVTEKEITRFIEEHPRWTEINSIANHVRPKPIIMKSDKPVMLNVN